MSSVSNYKSFVQLYMWYFQNQNETEKLVLLIKNIYAETAQNQPMDPILIDGYTCLLQSISDRIAYNRLISLENNTIDSSIPDDNTPDRKTYIDKLRGALTNE